MKRTHHCAQLRPSDIGNEVVLAGWVNKRRDLGGLIFVDLRDREGMTQLVFNPEHNKKLYETAYGLKREDVIMVSGKVRQRIEGQSNKDMPTGEVEVFAFELEIVGRYEILPLYYFVPSYVDTRL
ncbi:MAG: OB-fold nucleic acid binding domain-containing protein [Nanoarchaeota archaeon]|nr:OB-fold nucleic acid binding domain-containing protein [Nanoarchaeota archaeon]